MLLKIDTLLKYAGLIFIWQLFWMLPAQGQKLTLEPYQPGEGLSITAADQYKIRFSGFVQPMVESRYYPSMDSNRVYSRFRMRRMVTKRRYQRILPRLGRWHLATLTQLPRPSRTSG